MKLVDTPTGCRSRRGRFHFIKVSDGLWEVYDATHNWAGLAESLEKAKATAKHMAAKTSAEPVPEGAGTRTVLEDRLAACERDLANYPLESLSRLREHLVGLLH